MKTEISMVNPVEILKDGANMQMFQNSTEEIKTNFDRDVIVVNKDLFEDYGVDSSIAVFSKAVQVDSLTGCEYELTMFEMPNYTDSGLISSSGNSFIICYADEIADVFGFQTVDELIADVRKREELYANGDYEHGILKEFESSNISDVIPFNGEMTFRDMQMPDDPDEEWGMLVIKCKSENKTFYISTDFFTESEYDYYMSW